MSDKFFSCEPGLANDDQMYYHVRDPSASWPTVLEGQDHFVGVKKDGQIYVGRYGSRRMVAIYFPTLEAAQAACLLMG